MRSDSSPAGIGPIADLRAWRGNGGRRVSATSRDVSAIGMQVYADEGVNRPAFSIMRQKEHMPGADVGWPHWEQA